MGLHRIPDDKSDLLAAQRPYLLNLSSASGVAAWGQGAAAAKRLIISIIYARICISDSWSSPRTRRRGRFAVLASRHTADRSGFGH